jgi:hypothetical protein
LYPNPLRPGSAAAPLPAPPDAGPLLCLALAASEPVVAAGGARGGVAVWDVPSLSLADHYTHLHSGHAVAAVALVPTRPSCLYSGGGDGRVCLLVRRRSLRLLRPPMGTAGVAGPGGCRELPCLPGLRGSGRAECGSASPPAPCRCRLRQWPMTRAAPFPLCRTGSAVPATCPASPWAAPSLRSPCGRITLCWGWALRVSAHVWEGGVLWVDACVCGWAGRGAYRQDRGGGLTGAEDTLRMWAGPLHASLQQRMRESAARRGRELAEAGGGVGLDA